jgi:hypothetical protein
MVVYHLAGQDFISLHSLAGLEPYKSKKTIHDFRSFPIVPPNAGDLKCITQAKGWIGGGLHDVEMYHSEGAICFRVEDVGDFFIDLHTGVMGRPDAPAGLEQIESEVLSGPVLVHALALRGLWSFHAGAGLCKAKTIAFLGESGMGKSTLAAYLSQHAGWRLVADDILPVTGRPDGLAAYPHFPQLKLSPSAQPGVGLPERLPLDMIFELSPVASDALPEFKQLPLEQAVRVLLSHTAGTRLFDDTLLEAHLAFCAQAVESTPVYRLKYPHSRDALPKVKDMLESLC